jgi:predicted dehydrogenase
MKTSRRNFIKNVTLASSGIVLASTASSYANILGANDKLNVALVGMNGRGKALAYAIAKVPNISIGYVCDVDTRVIESSQALVQKLGHKIPKGFKDFRKLLEQKDLDAILIATPEHWHTPMAVMAMQAGKHAYVEKPCSLNPAEAELLVKAQEKYKKVVQVGTQQRSAPSSIQAINDIKQGVIGDVHFAKCWYANKRGSIGIGKEVAVPDWLDWDLWQGPAPRRPFKDNYVHYNWHWFWHWGTGEIHNNGTHEIDICRWAMGVDYPTKVSSTGGRYYFQDDWEFYDTQVVNYEFEGGKMITWEGQSCVPFKIFNRDRGAVLYGSKGIVILDRNLYQLFELDGKLIKEVKEAEVSATTNTIGQGGLDDIHMANFVEAIRKGTQLNAPVQEATKTNMLCHLGNIAQKMNKTLTIDTSNGYILNDPQAMALWSREYEKGWELKL